MKPNINFEIDGDICAVECDICDATVTICKAEGSKLIVQLPEASNVNLGNGDGVLYVSQKKRKLFCGRQSIVIHIPEQTVPAIKLSGKRFDASVKDGIFAAFTLNSEGGAIYLDKCNFESVEIIGGSVDAHFADCTVKGGLYVNIESGSILSENGFATRCEYRTRAGNIGLVNVTCKECVAETGKGNASVVVNGNERDFNYQVNAKQGTANLSGMQNAGAKYNVEVYSGEGNVVLEFSEPETYDEPETDEEQPALKEEL